jgi:hypothetical protein
VSLKCNNKIVLRFYITPARSRLVMAGGRRGRSKAKNLSAVNLAGFNNAPSLKDCVLTIKFNHFNAE